MRDEAGAGAPGGKERSTEMTQMKTGEEVVEQVRKHYGAIAVTGSSCCGRALVLRTHAGISRQIGYGRGARGGSAGGRPRSRLRRAGGAPGAAARRDGARPRLGARGSTPCWPPARSGPTGRVIGVDMTPEMLARARATAAGPGSTHVEFRAGRLEALPVEDASVDAVTSNCVINLVPDKAAGLPRGGARAPSRRAGRGLGHRPRAARCPRRWRRTCSPGSAAWPAPSCARDYFRMVEAAGLSDVRS